MSLAAFCLSGFLLYLAIVNGYDDWERDIATPIHNYAQENFTFIVECTTQDHGNFNLTSHHELVNPFLVWVMHGKFRLDEPEPGESGKSKFLGTIAGVMIFFVIGVFISCKAKNYLQKSNHLNIELEERRSTAERSITRVNDLSDLESSITSDSSDG